MTALQRVAEIDDIAIFIQTYALRAFSGYKQYGDRGLFVKMRLEQFLQVEVDDHIGVVHQDMLRLRDQLARLAQSAAVV